MQTLFDIWKKNSKPVHKSAVLARFWVRFLLYVTALANYIVLGINVHEFATNRNQYNTQTWIASFTINFLYFAVLVCAQESVRRFYNTVLKFDEDSKAITPLKRVFAEPLREILTPMAQKLNISNESIELYLDQDDYGEAPRVIEANLKIKIILPLGFFKVHNEDRLAAEAMLAHELGHVAQRDTALWAYASACTDRLQDYLLFMTAMHICVVLSWQYFNPAMFEGDRPNAADYISVFIIPIVYITGFFIVRGGRRTSEEMADLIALILVSPEGLIAALDRTGSNSSSRPQLAFYFFNPNNSIFSIHPSRTYRLKQIERYRNYVPGKFNEETKLNNIQSKGLLYQSFLAIAVGIIIMILEFLCVQLSSVELTLSSENALIITLLCIVPLVSFLWSIMALIQVLIQPRKASPSIYKCALVLFSIIASILFILFDPLTGPNRIGIIIGVALFVFAILTMLIIAINFAVGKLGKEFK